jgi:formylglycine-generating enzyme required for sulfatase activity
MSDKRALFLLGQQIYRLSDKVPVKDRQSQVCGASFDKDVWQPVVRDELCAKIIGPEPPQRVAVVCDAGLGKTTNMQWIQGQLATDDSQQVPLLLRLDDAADLERLIEERKPGQPSEALVGRLAKQIEDVAGGDPEQHRRAIRRLQSSGRITLLIDGLDHVTAIKRVGTMLQEMLDSRQWRHCPVWISGRPTAFEACWPKLFAASSWQFLRIQELAEPEIGFYLERNAGGNWYGEFPAESRSLLAIPRLLGLICSILKGAIAGARGDEAKLAAVRKLQLRTPADVYCRTFFHLGDYAEANDQGLLTQGLHGKAKWIGLAEGFKPRQSNRRKRVERTAALLGAIAFQMFDMNSKTKDPKPNFGSVRLDPFQDRVAERMEKAGLGTSAEFDRDFDLLKDMNIHALDHLLFREADEERLAFHDRTVQAFFAAYWACRHATLDELKATRKWVVDDLFEKNVEFREFWRFAAEMPDAVMPRDDDDKADEERWLALFRSLYDGSVKDSKRRPIRSTEFIYRSWKRMENSEAGREIIAKKFRAKSIPQGLVDGFIPLVKSGKPDDSGTFNMGREDQENSVTLTHFCLHEYCVTNVEYEQFDPRHQERRWWKSEAHRTVKELRDESADNKCPVIMVSWYDAWCFAKYLGPFAVGEGEQGREYEVVLPSEAQWEYACRVGRRTRFSFDEAHSGATCTPEYCNHDGTCPDLWEAKGEYRKCTLPVDGIVPPSWQNVKITSVKGRNRWGLYQMHGNVWEWCEEWYADASLRVLRGGGWDSGGGACQSANRGRHEPGGRNRDYGFRLAAVPVGAKSGKESGAERVQ